MLFKLECRVQELRLNQDDHEPIEFTYTSTTQINVSLRTLKEGERDYQDGYGVCTAVCSHKPDADVQAMLEVLVDRILPPGSTHVDSSADYMEPDGVHIAPDRVMPLEVFPDRYQVFATSLFNELFDYADRTVKVLKWRLRGTGPHNPCYPREFSFSIDGKNWHRVYDVWQTFLMMRIGLTPSAPYQSEIQDLVERGMTEPIGHELRREAAQVALINPRSCVILSVAAAESGIKQFVATVVPESQWLLENLPSPDIIKLCTKYIPELASRRPNGTILIPPKSITNSLQRAVEVRNKLVHLGKLPHGSDKNVGLLAHYHEREELLQVVADLLWILDFNCGHGWAIQYVGLETRLEMQLLNEPLKSQVEEFKRQREAHERQSLSKRPSNKKR